MFEMWADTQVRPYNCHAAPWRQPQIAPARSWQLTIAAIDAARKMRRNTGLSVSTGVHLPLAFAPLEPKMPSSADAMAAMTLMIVFKFLMISLF